MRFRARPELRLAVLAAIAAACALTLRADWHRGALPPPVSAPAASGSVGGARAPVSLGDLMIVVLRTPSVAERLAAGTLPSEAQERSWSAEAFAAQQQVLIDLASHGLAVRPDYSYARVLDGFSARLTAPAVALLESNPEVAGVYPVAVAYPASVSALPLTAGTAAPAPGLTLPGLDGAGVSIALLDTGVDAATPDLRGRVESAIDVLGADAASPHPAGTAAPGANAHGTELAGILVGAGGSVGAQGVAPAARVLPIEVAGDQPDGHGGQALYGRSDQIIAGLERAVDPNGQGDVADAVRIALLGLAEPYDGFADTPEAEAVRGALALGVLVVTPAGNDGAAGPSYGSVAGPGGSAAALTVAAVDSRSQTASEVLAVRQGLDVVARGTMPLLDGPAPSGSELPLVAAASRPSLRGEAVLVGGGSDPSAAVAHALSAGARAVLLEGPVPASAALAGLAVPVLWVPTSFARVLQPLLGAGAALELALGRVRGEPNPAYDQLAPFSSRGVAFDGLVDPELAAPGVDLPTVRAGRGPAEVSGTSAAAASVAGAAALLVQARPGLTAQAIASLLVGAARPGSFPLSAGGAGVLDLGASLAEEVSASTTSLGFGVWGGPRWSSTRALTLRNVSSRPLRLSVDPGSRRLRATPASLTLAPGASGVVRLVASARVRPVGTLLAGILTVSPDGGQPLRLPWTIGLPAPAVGLVRVLGLAPASFAPSLSRPALLRVAVGAFARGARLELEPVARLELRLYTARGEYLGMLASERDLLPGSYGFALTGRGPRGARLHPGAYVLAVVAWPVNGGPPSRARIGFRIE